MSDAKEEEPSSSCKEVSPDLLGSAAPDKKSENPEPAAGEDGGADGDEDAEAKAKAKAERRAAKKESRAKHKAEKEARKEARAKHRAEKEARRAARAKNEANSKVDEDSKSEAESRHDEDSRSETGSRHDEDSRSEAWSRHDEDSKSETGSRHDEDSKSEAWSRHDEDSKSETGSRHEGEDVKDGAEVKPDDEGKNETEGQGEDAAKKDAAETEVDAEPMPLVPPSILDDDSLLPKAPKAPVSAPAGMDTGVKERQRHMSLNFGCDSKIHSRIVRKRQSISYMSSPVLEDMDDIGVLFDQMMIIGARPTSEYIEGARPEILMMTPGAPLVLLPDEYLRLLYFCFPKGFHPSIDKAATDALMLNQFAFKIHGQHGRDFYGVCTSFTVPAQRDRFFFNEHSRRYPTCICLLTRALNLGAQFTFSSYLAHWFAGKCGKNKKSDFEIPEMPLDDEDLLPGMQWVRGGQRIQGILVPRVVLQELSYIRGIEARLSQEVTIKLSEGRPLIIPARSITTKSALYFGLDALFTCLSLKNVIKVMSMVLLERQLLFTSDFEHIVTVVIMCFAEIIKPFQYQGTLLPIVPNEEEFLGILDSPVPFIVGLAKITANREIPGNVVVIDLDRDEIMSAGNVPLIPHAKKITAAITRIFKDHKDEIVLPPRFVKEDHGDKKMWNPRYKQFVVQQLSSQQSLESYLYTFRRYIFKPEICDKLVSALRAGYAEKLSVLIAPCFVTDTTDMRKPVTVFNKDIFMDSISKKERPFYNEYANTMMFLDFCEIKTDETEKFLSQSEETSDMGYLSHMLGAPIAFDVSDDDFIDPS